MKNIDTSSMHQHHRPWQHQSREEKIVEIQELIVSPYWQHLNPHHRRQWLDQLGELQNQH